MIYEHPQFLRKSTEPADGPSVVRDALTYWGWPTHDPSETESTRGASSEEGLAERCELLVDMPCFPSAIINIVAGMLSR